jgi:hypothetical protein
LHIYTDTKEGESLLRLKRLFIGVFVVVFVGLSSYLIILNIFSELKIKGYDYLFMAKQPYDLVIKHAMVLNGTGEEDLYRADIAIRNGRIVGIGYINPKESLVFDAGGLTLIPWPIPIEAGEKVVEHLLSNAYPRYSADEVFLQNGPYKGLNLSEAAMSAEITPEELFSSLISSNDTTAKVLIAPLIINEEISTKEMLARLTGHRAEFLEIEDRGIIDKGRKADFYVFKTRNYSDEKLIKILRRGEVPEPIYKVQNGKFLNL